MDMRKYIAQRLDGMRSVTEKDMLRDVMEEIFIPMYDHIENQYDRLEKRVKEQLPLEASLFTIWNTLMERETAKGGCSYMFPMIEDDLTIPLVEIDGIHERLKAEREIRLDTVFVQADYLICREIIDSMEIYNGTIRTDEGDFRVGVRLRLSKRYIECIENLYRLFISNNTPWQTVNSPYLFKLFDVMLVRIEMDGKTEQGTVRGYEVSYGNRATHIRQGLVPVWNIQKLRIKSEDFPLAALDKVNYEYEFELGEEGAENGYLADYGSADISSVRREGTNLIVTSPASKGIVWDMYKIIKRKDYVTDYFPYELMSNTQEDSFASRMVSYYGTVIKTNAELRRMLQSYAVSGYIELESVQVISGSMKGETYEVNVFLKDEIRDLAVSKSLLLTFKPLKRNSFILRDIMSFLVSQVQVMYPEFHCVGVLV